jgi:Tol biopolymer transport system component/DNA-binding winged helix-turn-helix (wHTH) protein
MDPVTKASVSYRFDDVLVDGNRLRVEKDGQPHRITPRAFDVLVYLVEHRGRIVEKQELFDEVWKEKFVTDNALTRTIKEIRQVIGDDADSPRYIETVPKRGYRFIAEVKNLEATAQPETELPASEKLSAAHGESKGAFTTQETSAPKAGFALSKARVLGAIVLGVAAIAALIIWKTQIKSSETESPAVLRNVQLTTWPGLDIFPALAPDGNSVAYSSDHNGRYEIYARQLTPGAREVQITSDGQQNLSPAWSPDGQHIVYHSMNRGGIWLVPSSGGVAKQLSEFGSRPAWSPDGSLIAFQSRPIYDVRANGPMPPSTIWVVPARGGEPTPVTRVGVPVGGHGAPSWSPDGRRIVFVSQDVVGGLGIWSVSATGTDPKLVYQNGYNPVYSPDGDFIYFAGSVRGSNFGLFKIQVSPSSGEPSGEPIEIASTPRGPISHLTISADGKKIAYSAQFSPSNIWSISISPASGEATSSPVTLTNETNQKGAPSFSRDGRWIAFTNFRGGTPAAIWVMAADGTGARQLTTDDAVQHFSSWFPEGDRIAFLSYRRQRPEIWSTSLDTGKVAPVVDAGPDIAFPRLSPDGKHIAFNSARTGSLNVWVVAIEGGEPGQVTFDQELMGWPCWSPDGGSFAVEMKRGDDTHIAIVPAGGGSTRQLTFERGQSWPYSWSADGDRIAFAGYRNGVWNVWWVSRTTGVEKQVTNNTKFNAYIRYPAWSPLGNQIVYEYGETTGNIWLIELK